MVLLLKQFYVDNNFERSREPVLKYRNSFRKYKKWDGLILSLNKYRDILLIVSVLLYHMETDLLYKKYFK